MPLYDSRSGVPLAISSLEAILEGKVGEGLITKSPLGKPFTDVELRSMSSLSFAEVAARIIGRFFDDVDPGKVSEFCTKAYSPDNFDTIEIEPVVRVGDNYHLEQWHGKTAAFKDIALSVMPYFMVEALKGKEGIDKVLILGATSGDTGSAGQAGFYDISEVYVGIVYPENARVSEVQKRQMNNFQTDDRRICAYSVLGNFDFCQNEIVKPLLNDEEFRRELYTKHKCMLSSLNSINIGRLAPQITSFFWSYFKIGKPYIPVIPSGNFGHALSAYLAKEMGAPIPQIMVVSNENDALSRFIKTGKYIIDDFKTTNSPSMDISIPSNLERLIFYIAGPENTAQWFTELMEHGRFEVDTDTLRQIQDSFTSGTVNQEQTLEEIKYIRDTYKRLIDPHTAVASCHARKVGVSAGHPLLITETAHWGKFIQTMNEALKSDSASLERQVPSIATGISEIEGMHILDKMIADEGGTPRLTRYLSELDTADRPAYKSGVKPSTDVMKEWLVGQIRNTKKQN